MINEEQFKEKLDEIKYLSYKLNQIVEDIERFTFSSGDYEYFKLKFRELKELLEE